MDNPLQNKASKVLEIIWLIIAIFSFLIAVQSLFQKNWQNAIFFGIFIIIALLMNFIRKNNRLKDNN